MAVFPNVTTQSELSTALDQAVAGDVIEVQNWTGGPMAFGTRNYGTGAKVRVEGVVANNEAATNCGAITMNASSGMELYGLRCEITVPSTGFNATGQCQNISLLACEIRASGQESFTDWDDFGAADVSSRAINFNDGITDLLIQDCRFGGARLGMRAIDVVNATIERCIVDYIRDDGFKFSGTSNNVTFREVMLPRLLWKRYPGTGNNDNDHADGIQILGTANNYVMEKIILLLKNPNSYQGLFNSNGIISDLTVRQCLIATPNIQAISFAGEDVGGESNQLLEYNTTVSFNDGASPALANIKTGTGTNNISRYNIVGSTRVAFVGLSGDNWRLSNNHDGSVSDGTLTSPRNVWDAHNIPLSKQPASNMVHNLDVEEMAPLVGSIAHPDFAGQKYGCFELVADYTAGNWGHPSIRAANGGGVPPVTTPRPITFGTAPIFIGGKMWTD